ncbi:multiple C2 and transmembrane domain-containing protein-like [Diaphorina citri]|uniref:Multiple C2 and transmembrane domain-containing protein-like n=1 Tax=Diaphorina citri TaxID=121845 RepID=A0A3Q0INN7_DIACI|nr:multiple C2 and transmembrane domain-containing protein-like [Diaphorina citri]
MPLKDERWIRNRARHKTSAGSKSPKKLSGPSCNTPPPFLRQQSGVTDGGYTTDNSSECSSSVAPTPLTQSPQHRLYSNASSIHDNSELKIHLKRGRDLIARDKTGEVQVTRSSTTTAIDDTLWRRFLIFRSTFPTLQQLLYKSKTVYRDLNPSWDETFTLPIEDPFEPVQCKVFDYDWGLQDDFMGSASIDLTTLELGRCTDLILTLEDPNKPEENLGDIYLSATLYPRSQEDRDQYFQRNNKTLELTKRLKNQIWSSVVTIVLIHGKNLLPMDEDGLSDPYVKFRRKPPKRGKMPPSVALKDKSRVYSMESNEPTAGLLASTPPGTTVLSSCNVASAQGVTVATSGGSTPTSLSSSFGATSALLSKSLNSLNVLDVRYCVGSNVKDINSVLEVTVYDEDKDHKVEFLGKLAIPLLRIRNGERRWYALKDKKLTGRAKGNNPQILLEMDVVWNPIRACIRTLNPKEEKYMQTEGKFKRQVFVRNVMRLKVIVMWFYDIGIFLQDCFEWESTLKSLIAVILFIILCYYFEPYMVPIALLLIFLKGYVVQTLLSSHWSSDRAEDDDSGDEEDDEDDKDKEEKKSLKEKLQAIQEVTQIVQNSIGFIASLCESVKK